MYFVPSSVPCPPSIISKQYTCGNNSALVRWTDPVGSLGFIAHITGDGYQDSCHTTDTSCVLQNLPCGTHLDVSVQARGEHCNITASVSESLQTGDGRGHASCQLCMMIVKPHEHTVPFLFVTCCCDHQLSFPTCVFFQSRAPRRM